MSVRTATHSRRHPTYMRDRVDPPSPLDCKMAIVLRRTTRTGDEHGTYRCSRIRAHEILVNSALDDVERELVLTSALEVVHEGLGGSTFRDKRAARAASRQGIAAASLRTQLRFIVWGSAHAQRSRAAPSCKSVAALGGHVSSSSLQVRSRTAQKRGARCAVEIAGAAAKAGRGRAMASAAG